MNKEKLKLSDRLKAQIYWVLIRYVGFWIVQIQCRILAKKYGYSKDDPIIVIFDDYWDYMMSNLYEEHGLVYHKEKES